MENLIVYNTGHSKRRIGRNMDGGYVINELPGNYDILISGGIANDISFEIDFLNTYKGINCLAYDGTTNLKIDEKQLNNNITIIKKNLGKENNNNLTNLHEEIKDFNNIFLKLDIEGHEFRIIPTFNDEQMNKFKQIVLELHTPFDIQKYPDYFKGLSDLKIENLFDLLKKINKTHTLVHLHANNGCLMASVDKIPLPHVFEVTYIRNDFISKKSKNSIPLPTSLDCKNIAQKKDYLLDGFPYCCKY